MRGLTYPFTEPPASGSVLEVAPDIYWLRMPLPMTLDHINLYLVEDAVGWWIVDTGLMTEATRLLWEGVFTQVFGDKPVLGVTCTHMHPDHIGMAGWLCERWRVPLYMTQSEYLSARTFSQPGSDEIPWTTAKHYREAGLAQERIAAVSNAFRGFSAVVSPLPSAYHRLRDGDTFTFGGRKWRIIVGRGHSPEHACLYCESLNVLISGDQVIPRITSNVSVTSVEPRGNPLKEWLASHERLLDLLPADVLVLPAHNTPFYGLHQRLRYLIDHHEDHLLALEQACAEQPRTAVDLLPVLFRRALDDRTVTLALGECMAHLNYLTERGQLSRQLNEAGQAIYHSIDETLPLRLRLQHHVRDEAPLQV